MWHILFLIFLITELKFCTTITLRLSTDSPDTPVCTKVISILQSVRTPYIETYRKRTVFFMYKTAERLNFKTEYVPSFHTQEVCCPGYLPTVTSLLYKQKLDCQPTCRETRNGCENGTCIKPDVCECFSGYSKISQYECKPQCDNSCINGTCIAPNTCGCPTGYALNEEDRFICQPYCNPPCEQYSFCSAPDTCTCSPGYSRANSTICEPVCSRGCTNGECIKPETCRCKEGYRKNPYDDFICDPICTEHCIFGVCIAPDTCVCYPGYQSVEPLTHMCQPACEQNCTNGSCTAPNVCTCDPGYELAENSTYVCTPVCTMSCVNGSCVSPETCECREGYVFDSLSKTNESWICQPLCEGGCGTHGTCVAPNTCNCVEGYQLVNNITSGINVTCEPICNETCVNGKCSAPNTCLCDLGYGQFTNESSNVCEPICDGNCENGTCVAPNYCQCNEGFVQRGNEICIPACMQNCSGHGNCTDGEQKCECFFGWKGSDCEEPAFCFVEMDPNTIDLDTLNVRNETNNTVSIARENLPLCHRCHDTLNNETLCFSLLSDDATYVIGCFVAIESSCNTVYEYKTSMNMTTMGTILTVTLVVLASGALLAYVMLRKRPQEITANLAPSNVNVERSLPDEPLLGDEVDLELPYQE